MTDQILESPTDSVSAVKFSPTSPSELLAAGWDRHFRLYSLRPRLQTLSLDIQLAAPILDACFSDGKHAFSGGLDGRIIAYDLGTGSHATLSKHDDAVRCVDHVQEANLVVSGSWDKTLRVWDCRMGDPAAGRTRLPEKVFALSTSGNKVVVAMANRLVSIYDVRNLQSPLQRRESSLKFMTRTVECTLDGEGYVSTSIEGRVAVEFFDPSDTSQARKYAFKCHRQTIGGVDTVYPVNAISFHPIYGTFASGGGDGTVALWDCKAKKRMKQYPSYGQGINSISFSNDGRYMAMGTGGTEDEEVAGRIIIHEMSDGEGRGKT